MNVCDLALGKLAGFVVAALLFSSSLVQAQATGGDPELGDVGGNGQPTAIPPASPSNSSGNPTWSITTQTQAGQNAAMQPMAPAFQPVAPPTKPSMATTPEEPAPAKATSDHEEVVHTFGIGFFGISETPIGWLEGSTANFTHSVSAPTVGVRYWLSGFLGVEAGLGIGIESGSSKQGGVDSDLPSATVFALHGGVPLALAYSSHFVFEVVPEINIGKASGTGYPGGNEADLSGFLLEVGARAGAEIHFGFMGLPQLALQGSIGFHLASQSRTLEQSNTEFSQSTTRLGTSVDASPWHIFTDSVKSINAIYYF
jgi:hypothetical protein